MPRARAGSRSSRRSTVGKEPKKVVSGPPGIARRFVTDKLPAFAGVGTDKPRKKTGPQKGKGKPGGKTRKA
jgi:hypothetical protein